MDNFHQQVVWIAELIEATSEQVNNPNPVSRLYHTSLAVSLEVMKIMKLKKEAHYDSRKQNVDVSKTEDRNTST